MQQNYMQEICSYMHAACSSQEVCSYSVALLKHAFTMCKAQSKSLSLALTTLVPPLCQSTETSSLVEYNTSSGLNKIFNANNEQSQSLFAQ